MGFESLRCGVEHISGAFLLGVRVIFFLGCEKLRRSRSVGRSVGRLNVFPLPPFSLPHAREWYGPQAPKGC